MNEVFPPQNVENAFKFSTGAIVLSIIFGCSKINTAGDKKIALIWQKSGEPLQWRHKSGNVMGHEIGRILHGTILKPIENGFIVL